jgi:hypothetical protein
VLAATALDVLDPLDPLDFSLGLAVFTEALVGLDDFLDPEEPPPLPRDPDFPPREDLLSRPERREEDGPLPEEEREDPDARSEGLEGDGSADALLEDGSFVFSDADLAAAASM